VARQSKTRLRQSDRRTGESADRQNEGEGETERVREKERVRKVEGYRSFGLKRRHWHCEASHAATQKQFAAH